MSHRIPSRRRRGFTLVELLVVITIIGMLMALSSFAVWGVIRKARVTKIAVELDQLSQAMNGYKQTRIQYPPCMGTINLTNRKTEFLRHISLAYTNANYGSTAANFDSLRTAIANTWKYNYASPSGSLVALDLHTLDQAESLVFWLGGFPTPISTTAGPIANRRLFGFHRDEDNPFKRDVAFEAGGTPLQYRTDPQFNFEEQRLVDIDGDGWLEYAPLAPRTGELSAPYVYFDSYTYGLSTNMTSTGWRHYGYPRPDTNGAAASTARDAADRFGTTAPFANFIDPAKKQTTRWANATGIQIVCGGLDGKYGASVAGGTALSSVQRVITFPQGRSYGSGDGFTSAGGLAMEELDNQTNLSNRTLDDERTQSAQ